NTYIGGAEHAVLHLLYARFICMALYDMGHVGFEEPYPFLYSNGLLIKEGAKMSKSRGNIINPDEYIEKYGADSLRSYLRFLGPLSDGGDFRDTGMEGMHRFILKIWNLSSSFGKVGLSSEEADEVRAKMHKTIKKVT